RRRGHPRLGAQVPGGPRGGPRPGHGLGRGRLSMPGGTARRGAPEPGRDGGELLAPGDLAEVVAAVGHLLHAAGVPVTPERSGRFARAVTLARPATLDELYWAGRVTLLGGADQVPVYDAVFAQVFRGQVDVADRRGQEASGLAAAPRARAMPVDRAPARAGATAGPPPAPRVMTPAGGSPGDEAVAEGADVLAAASPEERLGRTDLAALSDDELAALRPLLAALPWAAPRRPGRRTTRHRRGRRLDLRATLRSARRTGGDPVRRIARRRVDRPRRLVLLADVSGSMAPDARAWLHLLHGAVRAARADAFVFATRLTRLTRALAPSDPDAALRRATAAAPDWSGGTRIGAALAAFVDRHGRRGVARGAGVVIVSDGWTRAAPRWGARRWPRAPGWATGSRGATPGGPAPATRRRAG